MQAAKKSELVMAQSRMHKGHSICSVHAQQQSLRDGFEEDFFFLPTLDFTFFIFFLTYVFVCLFYC